MANSHLEKIITEQPDDDKRLEIHCTSSHRYNLLPEKEFAQPYTAQTFRRDLDRHICHVRDTHDLCERVDKTNSHFAHLGNPEDVLEGYGREIRFCKKQLERKDFPLNPKGFYYTLYNLSNHPDCPWSNESKFSPLSAIDLAIHARNGTFLANLASWTSINHISKLLVDRYIKDPNLSLHVKAHGAPMLYFEIIHRGKLPKFLLDTVGRGGLPVLMMGGVPPFDNVAECPVSLAEFIFDPKRPNSIVVGDGEMSEGRLLGDLFTLIQTPDRECVQIIVDANAERMTGCIGELERDNYQRKLQILATLIGTHVSHCNGHDLSSLEANLPEGEDAIVISDTEKAYGLGSTQAMGNRHQFVPKREDLLDSTPQGLMPEVRNILAEYGKDGVHIVTADGAYLSGPAYPNRTIVSIDEAKALVHAFRKMDELSDTPSARNNKLKRLLEHLEWQSPEDGLVPVGLETATPYLCPPWTIDRTFTIVRDEKKSLEVQENCTIDLLQEIGNRQLPIYMLGLTYVASYGPPSDYVDHMMRNNIHVIEPRSIAELKRVLDMTFKNKSYRAPVLLSVTNLPPVDQNEDSKLISKVDGGDAVCLHYPESSDAEVDTILIAFGSTGILAEHALDGQNFNGHHIALLSISNTIDIVKPERLFTALGIKGDMRRADEGVKNVIFLQTSQTSDNGQISSRLKGIFPSADLKICGLNGDIRALESPLKEALCRGGLCPKEINQVIRRALGLPTAEGESVSGKDR